MIKTKYIEFMIDGETVFMFFAETFQHGHFAKLVSNSHAPKKVQVLSAGFASMTRDKVELFGESISLGIRANREAKVTPATMFATVFHSSLIAATNQEFLQKVFDQETGVPEIRENDYGDAYLQKGKALLFYR